MNINKLAYEVASAKAVLTEAEAKYKALCAAYLAAGGQSVVVEALGVKVNVINPTKTEIDSEGLAKHMVKIGKVKELAASVTVVMSRLTENTDKVFSAKMAAKFGNEVAGTPFIKVSVAA